MIDLSDRKPFASGGNRHCYVHPAHPDRCVKVMRPGRIAELRRRASWYKALSSDASFDDNVREVEGYRQKVLRTAPDNSPVWQHLPRWYGTVETSEGAGAVTELILDENGAPALTLETYLEHHGLDAPIRAALERLAVWLRATGVLSKNLLPHNLVIRKCDGQPELCLIDGLGSAAFLPAVERLQSFRRRYIERRIQRMWVRVEWEVSDRALTWKQAEKLSRQL